MDNKLKRYPSDLASQSPCNTCTTAALGCINNCRKIRVWTGQCVNKLMEIEKLGIPMLDQQLAEQTPAAGRKDCKNITHPAKSGIKYVSQNAGLNS